MYVFEIIVALLLAGAGLTALSATIDAPGDELSAVLRRRYELLLRRAEVGLASGARDTSSVNGSDGQAFDASPASGSIAGAHHARSTCGR